MFPIPDEDALSVRRKRERPLRPGPRAGVLACFARWSGHLDGYRTWWLDRQGEDRREIGALKVGLGAK
jgi:hypothetical protein